MYTTLLLVKRLRNSKLTYLLASTAALEYVVIKNIYLQLYPSRSHGTMCGGGWYLMHEERQFLLTVSLPSIVIDRMFVSFIFRLGTIYGLLSVRCHF